MTNIYTLDSIAKHPIEAAAWELPGHDCPLCQEPMNQTDRCCSLCRLEAAQLARDVVMPALAELMWRRVNGFIPSAIVDSDTARIGRGPTMRGSDGTPSVTAGAIPAQGGHTVRAPEADEPAAATSVATIYDLIRSHAGFMLLVAGGV